MQSHLSVVAPGDRVRGEARPDWFSRSIVSGFTASVTMLFAYLVAFALAIFLSGVQWSTIRGGSDLSLAFHNLINNPVVDLARGNLYVALAIYIAGGLFWAAIYARYFEPRLVGPDWRRGISFAAVPFLVSVLVVLPLLGGGLLGLGLGAGPLPLIGNLVLHLVYGAVLGVMYGPFGDTIQAGDGEAIERGVEQRAQAGSERAAARWLVGGLVIGVVLGIIGDIVAGVSASGGLLSAASLAFIVATMLITGAVGALAGSFAGISGAVREQPRG